MEKFLLEEYSNIAQAHFKSIETISTFFRYYILIMTIPISAIIIISRIGADSMPLSELIQQYKLHISIILLCVSLIGLGVFCYIVNLRLDVILYARAVNGIRKFFYDKSDIDINIKLRMRALPQSPQLPPYLEKSYTLPVVFTFSILNTLYASFPYYAYYTSYIEYFLYDCFIIAITSYLALHFLVYMKYTEYREIAYLKSNILAIDIDGVLNKHREHFCNILQQNTGKQLMADDILTMPVHEYQKLNITRSDERQVFNDPKYWKDMPEIEEASNLISNLKNIFKLKIYIFTYRPWPDVEVIQELKKKVGLFCQQYTHFSFGIELLKILIKTYSRIPFRSKILKACKEKPLKHITKDWLKEKRIVYDKYIFEKGNDFSSDPRGEFTNRFYISRKKKIRFFIEDDIEKALKLSFICDVVFLLSHPYNKENEKLPGNINKLRENIPSNVLRVNDWSEIYQYLRRLS